MTKLKRGIDKSTIIVQDFKNVFPISDSTSQKISMSMDVNKTLNHHDLFNIYRPLQPQNHRIHILCRYASNI